MSAYPSGRLSDCIGRKPLVYAACLGMGAIYAVMPFFTDIRFVMFMGFLWVRLSMRYIGRIRSRVDYSQRACNCNVCYCICWTTFFEQGCFQWLFCCGRFCHCHRHTPRSKRGSAFPRGVGSVRLCWDDSWSSVWRGMSNLCPRCARIVFRNRLKALSIVLHACLFLAPECAVLPRPY